MSKYKEIIEPFYCQECKKCSNSKEMYSNLKITNNTGWTHNIYCLKRKTTVHGI